MKRFRSSWRVMRPALLVVCCVVAAASAPGFAQEKEKEVPRAGNGVTLPKPTHTEKPKYTAEAMKRGIQGSVLLDMVVLTDGTVDSVKVVRSLDPTYGLDDEAIRAARQWRFEPGLKDGKPVAVLVTLELTFWLRDKKETTETNEKKDNSGKNENTEKKDTNEK